MRSHPFTIAVVSGKGGTGKTTVATSLALTSPFEKTLLLDCDVEAPNDHLFLQPDFAFKSPATIPTPSLLPDRCDGCGRCAEVCRYNAIVVIGGETLIFPELCHGCGSCVTQCPQAALEEVNREMGVLEAGRAAGGICLAQGCLNVGEPMPVPVIRQLKAWDVLGNTDLEIRDAPPGTSCSVVETLRSADVALLVTEATPFGLHDLRLGVELVRKVDLPMGVVINRSNSEAASEVHEFCEEQSVPVLLELPFRREIAAALAAGIPLVHAFPEFLSDFYKLFHELEQLTIFAAKRHPAPSAKLGAR
ncbi:MAG: ATP-binding protein [Anaerolineales bacterium]